MEPRACGVLKKSKRQIELPTLHTVLQSLPVCSAAREKALMPLCLRDVSSLLSDLTTSSSCTAVWSTQCPGPPLWQPRQAGDLAVRSAPYFLVCMPCAWALSRAEPLAKASPQGPEYVPVRWLAAKGLGRDGQADSFDPHYERHQLLLILAGSPSLSDVRISRGWPSSL